MKKIIATVLTLVVLLSLVACGSPSAQTPEPSASESVSDTSTLDAPAMEPTGSNTLEELEGQIAEYLSTSISSLSSQWEVLSTEIDTYDKYVENTDKVSAFYQTVISETDQMCIALYEYAATYARMVLDSDLSASDMYDAVDGIHDHLYEDACDMIHDEIYDGILDEMYDHFYDGILDDAKDDVNYSDWYAVSSDEYEQWYDASSDAYELYYDTSSEIYSFYHSLSSELYRQDLDGAEDTYERFLKKIAKANGQETEAPTTAATFDTNLRTADGTEELEAVVAAHVNECVQALWAEWDAFSAEIDTFDEYVSSVDAAEDFHTHMGDAAWQLLVMICDYGTVYAEMILDSDASSRDQYKAFEDFKNCIYEDACQTVKDEIYEDLLDEIKDYYYDGIIDEAKDDVDYSTWSDLRGDAYDWWSDVRGEIYDNWSDTRGDLYSFFSDIRSELYDADTDGANKELQHFKEDVADMK